MSDGIPLFENRATYRVPPPHPPPGHSETVQIHTQQDAMKAAWAGMQDLMANRAKRLAGAHEIHKFNRDAKELLDRLQVGHWGQGGREEAAGKGRRCGVVLR